ncbi:MAG: potassium channel family protein [Clostridium butyricum]|nr:potassium channel family protein [Clostridium butyricum]
MKDLEFAKSEKTEFIYDICAGIMSIIAVIVVMMEYSVAFSNMEIKIVYMLDKVIYWIFVFDYIIRFVCSKDKRKFFKYNIVDLIAIIPLMYIFEYKFGSVFKLIRVGTYILRLLYNIKEILFTNGFIYALGIITVITIIGSIGIYFCEVKINSGIRTFEDALWWSVVTVTTVGYGDIIVVTRAGRIIACMLMITGVCFISMLTSTMSTYFFSKLKEWEKNDVIILENLEHYKDFIDLSQLTKENRKNLINYYKYLLYTEKDK